MPLPFTVPALTRGFAALTPAVRTAGARAAVGAARALSEALDAEVAIAGRPLPGRPLPGVGVARVLVRLEALPECAAFELDLGFLSRLVQRLGAGDAAVPAALAATGVERALLELLALVALDGARDPAIDDLVPRLAAAGEVPRGELAIAVELVVGDDRGRGRLLVPEAAVAALRARSDAGASLAALEAIVVPASFRSGTTSLTREDLCLLAPGDVVLLDEGVPRLELVITGGLAFRGRPAGDGLVVEEILMTNAQASFPITLAVEVARVTLTLGELSRLEPGAVVPLGVAPEGAVVLRAGERAVARGRLVDVDGALGVQIAELGDRP
jgi:type III secretion protein Q